MHDTFEACAGLLLQYPGLIVDIGGTDTPKPHTQPVSPAEQADFEAFVICYGHAANDCVVMGANDIDGAPDW